MSSSQQHAAETLRGERFEFGANWARFIAGLDEAAIELAVESLRTLLQCDSLAGKSFLDVGSGSGLSSLAASRLGARVYSFDYDPQSVACTAEVKRRNARADKHWKIETGSVLDGDYLHSLGQFDVVYSWGVLHHTGSMWQALENVIPLVAPGGSLAIAIYNDQGWASAAWKRIKRLYNRLPVALRPLLSGLCAVRLWGPTMLKDLLRLRPLHSWRNYSRVRGMSPWRDVVDWVGGYPFEVARPDDVFRFYRDRSFELKNLTTCAGGHGCCEYVFTKSNRESGDPLLRTEAEARE